MIYSRFGRYTLGIFAAATILAGCGGGTSAPTAGNCNSAPQPFVQQLYPIPGSKDVKPNVGVLILAGNEHQLPWLTTGKKTIFGRFIPPPNPLPQPELTPAPGASLYAASLRTLAHKTQYAVSVSLVLAYCDPFTYPKKLGSFTTH